MIRKSMLAGAVALAAISTAAYATVTFDTTTGTGFVGKGDVQLAFGWNNAVMQSRHLAVTFVADTSAEYDVTCEWDTVTGKSSKTVHHIVTNHKTVGSTAAVDSTSRKTGQYTGWFLTGMDGSLDGGDAPAVGDSCPQGGGNAEPDPEENDAVVTAVSLISGGGGTLSAVWNGDARVIYTF
jgi:hypothetical protein